MIDIVLINNQRVVRKKVNNTNIYEQLTRLNFKCVPEIIKIEDNYVYYEYIEGKNLYQKINEEDLSKTNRMLLGLSLIYAVKEINELGIIHKDIKPENIIIGDNNKVYLIDFEGSRFFDGQKSRDTILLGTEGYASPEHYGYTETTFKSDMFSLGKVLNDLDLPFSFTRVINRCTMINPEERYANYKQLIEQYEKRIVIPTKKDYFKKYYRFNYDNSKIQWVITFLCALLVILSVIVENTLKFDSFENSIYSIDALIILIVGFAYVTDFIRITIKTIRHKTPNYLKYVIHSLLTYLALISVLVILTVFIVLISRL